MSDNMDKCKVVRVTDDYIKFDNGITLGSNHNQDCCETHFLSFKDIDLSDFDGLEFDLTGDKFFERIPDYGIALNPILGHPIRIPGYGYNNGYYSSDLDLTLTNDQGFSKDFDISECQVVEG